MKRPLRVLQVVHALGMGGAETWLMELLRHWARTGAVEMEFLATGGEPDLFDEEAMRLGARIHYVRYGRAHMPSFVRRFRQILAAGRYDAIHDHADYASGWHFLAGLGTLPPVRVTHVHNPWLHIEVNYGSTPLRRLAVKVGRQLVDRVATDVCGTSQSALDKYGFESSADSRGSVRVVHCGIDVARFSAPSTADRDAVRSEFGWPANAKIVLLVGRLDRALEFDNPQNHKNSWFAVNVVRAAAAKDPAVRGLVAGAWTDSTAELQSRIAGWGLERNLLLLHVREDVPRLMRASDVLLFPSREEGLGMVAVEAQAAGLPVLASSAVPRECVVVSELYDAMPLSESVDRWAEALLARIAKSRPSLTDCRRALEASAFSIEESSRRLEAVYSSRLL